MKKCILSKIYQYLPSICFNTNPYNEKYGIVTAEGKVVYESEYLKIHYNISSPLENGCITFDFDENIYSLPNRYIVEETEIGEIEN